MKNPQTTRKLKVRRVCIWVVSHTARRIKSSQWLNKALLPSTSIAFSHKLCVHSQREIERERDSSTKIARRVAMILTQFQTSIAGQG